LLAHTRVSRGGCTYVMVACSVVAFIASAVQFIANEYDLITNDQLNNPGILACGMNRVLFLGLVLVIVRFATCLVLVIVRFATSKLPTASQGQATASRAPRGQTPASRVRDVCICAFFHAGPIGIALIHALVVPLQALEAELSFYNSRTALLLPSAATFAFGILLGSLQTSHARLLRDSALHMAAVLVDHSVISIRTQSWACFSILTPLLAPFAMGVLCIHLWMVRRDAILPRSVLRRRLATGTSAHTATKALDAPLTSPPCSPSDPNDEALQQPALPMHPAQQSYAACQSAWPQPSSATTPIACALPLSTVVPTACAMPLEPEFMPAACAMPLADAMPTTGMPITSEPSFQSVTTQQPGPTAYSVQIPDGPVGHSPAPRRQQTWVMPPSLQVPVPTPLPGHTPLPRRQEPWVMPPDLQAPVPTPLPGHTTLPRRQQTWVMPPDLQAPVPTPLPGHTPLPRRQEPWVMPPDLQGPSPPPLLLSLTGGPQASSMLPGCPSPRQAEHGMPVAPMQPPFEPPPRTLIDFLQIAKLPHRSPQQQRPPAPPTILDALRLAKPPRRSQQQHHQLPPPLTILDALHEQQQQQQQQQQMMMMQQMQQMQQLQHVRHLQHMQHMQQMQQHRQQMFTPSMADDDPAAAAEIHAALASGQVGTHYPSAPSLRPPLVSNSACHSELPTASQEGEPLLDMLSLDDLHQLHDLINDLDDGDQQRTNADRSRQDH
jgi:hypothetical protein